MTSVVLLTEQVGPVARHTTAGTGYGLVLGMALRWRKFGTLVVVIGLVVPEPVFARLERSDDRVPGLSPVLRRVPSQRIVAATNVAACRTPPQVHPPTAGGITFGAADATGHVAARAIRDGDELRFPPDHLLITFPAEVWTSIERYISAPRYRSAQRNSSNTC